jgi:tetratricopeptide (TPR) repeat protein
MERTMTIRRAIAALAIGAAVATMFPPAAAADPKADAQVLADQGAQLMKGKRYPEACAAFEASIQRYPALATRAKLAECYEKIDRLASAWALYREVADAAQRDKDRKRAKAAKKKADALAARVPKITITVPPEAKRDGMTITRDGVPVSAAELGLAMNVDAGRHTIGASAPGMTGWTLDVDAVDGASTDVAIPPLAPIAAATPPEPAKTTPEPAKTTPDEPEPVAGSTIVPGTKRAKDAAQTLVTEGVALVEQKEYQLALDRFVAAYDLYPSPKLLLNMASTLREMGRTSDAADMYQAFIEAPDTNAEFVGEAKGILNGLDEQLFVLMVRVTPRGADVQLDGGPWVSVGEKRMMVRLKPGIHMVRARRHGFAIEELTINAFEGEKNDLELVLKVPVDGPAPASGTGIATGGTGGGSPDLLDPDDDSASSKAVAAGGASKDGSVVIPLLTTGTRAERGGVQYKSTAVIRDDDGIVSVLPAPVDTEENELGITAQLRIDGSGGGAALAAGISFAPGVFPRLELDLTGMVSKPTPPSGIEMEAKRIYGVFLGARFRLLTRQIRPTLGAGMPMFFSEGKPRVGVRGSGGVELVINGHLAVVGELGYEHFFNTQTGYKADVFVPLVQVTGRF